jgi:3-phosphoshikimate 1-carboxyvinyltransferase
VAVTGSHLLEEVTISGVSTLRHKESNRIIALKTELEKTGVELKEIGTDVIVLKKTGIPLDDLSFDVYNDHRMAMCLAPLTLKFGDLVIRNPLVVDKSFPNFWKEMEKVGIYIATS